MIESESRLPLLLGAVVALILHVALVPVWAVSMTRLSPEQPSVPPKQDKPLPAPQEVEVGKADNSTTNLAWIAYDDYQALLARFEIIEQPALQRQEAPTPDAPIEMDPTPPAPNSEPSETPGVPGEDAAERETVFVPISPVGPVPLPDPQADGEIPYAPPGPMPRDAPLIVEAIVAQPDTDAHHEPSTQPGSPDADAKPTSAPRDEGEAQPVTFINQTIQVKPGAVLTGKGIEIKTVVLRPPIITRLSAIPKNPTAEIYFNNKGKVTHVELIRSTDAVNWDETVVTALEQWTAKGERIDALEGEIKLTVELLILQEP